MALVKLILHEDVANLGEAGNLVSVKPGYARNYLLAQGKAEVATEARVQHFEHQKRVVSERIAKDLATLTAVRDRISSVKLEVTARVGEEGKLFGSVTAAQIAELLAEKGFKIDRRKIVLSEPIKEVGDHVVPIRLKGQLVAEVTVKVAAEDAKPEAADVQAEDAQPAAEEA